MSNMPSPHPSKLFLGIVFLYSPIVLPESGVKKRCGDGFLAGIIGIFALFLASTLT